MEFVILTLGYFALLGAMIYKGVDVGTILGAAASYVGLYMASRSRSIVSKDGRNNTKKTSKDN